MGANCFLIVSSCIFSLVCILQATRLALRWPVKIAAFNVPYGASWIAVALSGAMSIWGFWLAFT